MSRFLNNALISLDAYTPGEQPRDKAYIKLNTNESPYPPSPETVKAISSAEVSDLNLYPDPTCKELKKALAERYSLNENQVFVSNGSDDILNFAFLAFAGKGGKAYFPDISYGFYEVFCELHGVTANKIPLKQDFSICVDDYFNKSGMVVIANPNAPTGLCLSLEEIKSILDNNSDQVVVIDEAYVDFGGQSAVSLIENYENLLVVETFSKSRSMAGARLGFALGNKELIEDLEKIKYSTNPYSINRLTLIAGVSAIKSDSYYMENCEKIIKTRDFVTKELKNQGFVVLPSSANFIFAKKDGIEGKKLYEALKENGVLVRHFNKERISDFIRITIGTDAEMQSFLQIIKKICEEEIK